MAYRAVLERWDAESMLFVCELPGCVVSASTVETVLTAAPGVIYDYLRWARARGIKFPAQDKMDLSVIEEGQAVMPGVGPFFAADLGMIEDDEFERAIAVCKTAINDLIRIFEEADERQQNYKASETEWSPREIMQHLAAMEIWYSTRPESGLSKQNGYEMPADPVEALKFASECANFSMREVFEKRRNHKFERDYEEWSLIKMIRRRAGHLREHYPQLLLAVRQRIP